MMKTSTTHRDCTTCRRVAGGAVDNFNTWREAVTVALVAVAAIVAGSGLGVLLGAVTS
jgi:hypothetical protein